MTMTNNVHINVQKFKAEDNHWIVNGTRSRAILKTTTPGFHHPHTLQTPASHPKASPDVQQKITGTSDKENVNTARGIPVSAPVPVWCPSIGKNALRSILAMSEEGECSRRENSLY